MALPDEGSVYRIRIEGRLGAHWSERLSGMRIVVHETEGRNVTTELTGRLADQAALNGVIDQLYTLGATLVAVERLEADTGAQPVKTVRAPRRTDRS